MSTDPLPESRPALANSPAVVAGVARVAMGSAAQKGEESRYWQDLSNLLKASLHQKGIPQPKDPPDFCSPV